MAVFYNPPVPAVPRPHLFDHTLDSLADLFAEWGLPRFRAAQVLDWVYRKGVADPAAMTNLSRRDRALIADRLDILRGTVIKHQVATDGTQKLLIEWGLGNRVSRHDDAGVKRRTENAGEPNHEPLSLPLLQAIPDPNPQTPDPKHQTECVMIPSDGDASGRLRRTACISSQIGCPVGCAFCASGLGGLDGNLTVGQIVQQAWQLANLNEEIRMKNDEEDDAPASDPFRHSSFGFRHYPPLGLTNLVFMGMGEPLANPRAVFPALRALTADWGLNLSARKVTVSTVGVPAGIRKLADLDLPVTLAISLHAPNDALRQQIIPWANRVTIDQLVDAGRAYFAKTGREITLEYILLAEVNDRPEHAHELAAVAKRLRSNVNLIRYNEVAGLPFNRPEDTDVHRFQHILRQAHVNVHLRASRGRDIAAACGQLRHETTPA